jgi:hypothetical protein
MAQEIATTVDTKMVYVYPCPTCGERVGSYANEPVECDDCDPYEHEYIAAWVLNDPSIRFCEICDIDEDEHN